MSIKYASLTEYNNKGGFFVSGKAAFFIQKLKPGPWDF